MRRRRIEYSRRVRVSCRLRFKRYLLMKTVACLSLSTGSLEQLMSGLRGALLAATLVGITIKAHGAPLLTEVRSPDGRNRIVLQTRAMMGGFGIG